MKTYEKSGDTILEVTEEVKTQYDINELKGRKDQIESILKREKEKYQAELDTYQPQLDEVNALISEAEKLEIKADETMSEGSIVSEDKSDGLKE